MMDKKKKRREEKAFLTFNPLPLIVFSKGRLHPQLDLSITV